MLNVSDVARAVRFYIETLGMKLVAGAETQAADGTVIIDAGEGFHLGLRKGTAPTSATEVIFYPKVPLEEAIAIFENRGVTFTKTGEGKALVARFKDDDGNLLALAAG